MKIPAATFERFINIFSKIFKKAQIKLVHGEGVFWIEVTLDLPSQDGACVEVGVEEFIWNSPAFEWGLTEEKILSISHDCVLNILCEGIPDSALGVIGGEFLEICNSKEDFTEDLKKLIEE